MYVYNYNNFVKILCNNFNFIEKKNVMVLSIGIKNSKIVLMRLLILIKSC